jgi:hypothetical protein
VTITVSSPGQYLITTDTSNGIWFRDSGYTTLGTNTIKLKGYGTPILPINADFLVTYGSSFCTFTVPYGVQKIIRDYFPTTNYSNWGYYSSTTNDTTGVTSLKDTSINVTNYRMFFSSKNDSTYYRKSNGDYYQYGKLPVIGGTTEFIFLKDYVSVGSQWDSPTVPATYLTLSTQAKIRFTLQSLNITKTVGTNTFDSVIAVQQDILYLVAGNYQTFTTGYSYYAKNVGLIDVEFPALTPPSSYTIRRWNVY